jgi:Tol biopolymer transport system component
VILALVGLLTSGCAFIVRASVDTEGGDPDGFSRTLAIGADGRYLAFFSVASDLVADGGGSGVFLRDLRAGSTARVSREFFDPQLPKTPAVSVSENGRYVAWDSDQGHVAGDDLMFTDVFVRDMQTGVITRVSVDTAGGNPNGSSVQPHITSDGRYVTFTSGASDLVSSSTAMSHGNAFVRDLQTGTTTRVSVDASGGDPNSNSKAGGISADGRYVALLSFATDLVTGPAGTIFVRDLQMGTTTPVDLDVAGGAPDSPSVELPSISGNGRYVAFVSFGSDLVTGPAGSLFLRDVQMSTTIPVDLNAAGGGPNGAAFRPSISADGRYVAFDSDAADLVPNDDNDHADVFVRDTEINITTRASVDFLGREANGDSGFFTPSISADGRYVAFDSLATNLVANDGTAFSDVFVRAVVTPTVASVTPASVARGSATTLTLIGTGFFPGAKVSANAFGPGGVTVNSVTVISETELEANVSVDVDASNGDRNVSVFNPGTGPGPLATGWGFCFGCLTIT